MATVPVCLNANITICNYHIQTIAGKWCRVTRVCLVYPRAKRAREPRVGVVEAVAHANEPGEGKLTDGLGFH